MPFVLIVHIQVKPEFVEDTKKQFPIFAASYRGDVGTLAWNVHQDTKDPTKFAIVERYVSPKDIKAHTSNPTYKVFGAWAKDKLVGPPQILSFNELEVVGAKNQESKL